MKKNIVWMIKLVVMAAIFAFVAIKLARAWHNVGLQHLRLDWRFEPLIPLAFLGIMTTGALTWLWLARRMGDRSPTVPLLGAYTFSQAGKYAPGKVFLVLMRVDRTHRAGMSRETCVLSTLLENAMYTLSGALVGAVALLVVARDHPLYLGLCALLILLLLGVFHPRVFFPLLNMALKSIKRGPIAPGRRFRLAHMVGAVIMFLPCWIFGGLALWASVRAMQPIALYDWPRLCGVFALSVSLGMFSLLPGGLGVREAVQALFLAPLVGSPAIVVAAVALPRVFQIMVELTLAGLGGAINARLTSKHAPATAASDPGGIPL